MALLQIAEPGQSADPHERRIAIGIDLGTTYSLVAAVRSGVSECLPDDDGRVIVPSVVHYGENGKCHIGESARSFLLSDASNTVFSAKRLMGRGKTDIAYHTHLPYQVVELQTAKVLGVQTVQGVKSAVEVSAQILAYLRQRAQDTFDSDIYGAVITVPAYFDDAQRQATKDAATLAGLNVLRLINEPTAAAIAYGLDNASEGLYAVYDLGGGTFDVSILRLTQGIFEVIATAGDSALGGDDFDRAILNFVLEKSTGSKKEAAHPSLSAQDMAALTLEARRCKEALSDISETTFFVSLSGHKTLNVGLSRDDFEEICQPLLKKTIQVVQSALNDADLAPEAVDGVVLVGGSTRMPMVQKAVGNLFGKEPLINLNPDEVVALGAAIQANQLAGNERNQNLLLLDVVPLSLGIETMGGLVERIISRNQPIPVAMAQDFTTYQDGQTALSLHVVQGERDLVKDCRSLAHFTLRGIPPMAAGAARIRVTFTVDADGLLSVSAQEQNSGAHASISVKPMHGLEDAQIMQMLQESFATAQKDIEDRTLIQARVEANRVLLALDSALQKDATLLETKERTAIEQAQSHLAALLTQEPKALAPAIEQATQRLAQITENFAAKRMNAGIAQALRGQRIDSLASE